MHQGKAGGACFPRHRPSSSPSFPEKESLPIPAGRGSRSYSPERLFRVSYPAQTLLHIAGCWRPASGAETIPVENPATEEIIGHVAKAASADLDEAVDAARTGFQSWRKVPANERCAILRRAAALLGGRIDDIARILTLEQGKPLDQARAEVESCVELIEWAAEEGRRAYGHVIPARDAGITQLALREPIGPVAAFSPWNFPLHLAVRKLAPALAAGCSIILKAAEETPASCAAVIAAFAEAGFPAGAINLLFGDPAQISESLISSPAIRKISFTGSTAVGKHLAAMAGAHMKPATFELGGHAPVLIFSDADLDRAAALLCAQKFRNAGQICTSPTRFLVERPIYENFLGQFTEAASAVKVGDGLDPASQMGPLANIRRLEAMERFVADAVEHGASLRCGGGRIANKGYFFEPTVLGEVSPEMQAMNEEPFGPLALVQPFDTFEDALAEANRLPYGLAAYAYTGSGATASVVSAGIESGMVSVNHHGIPVPEAPFGGVKESGIGSEGGSEALEGFMITKFVTRMEG